MLYIISQQFQLQILKLEKNEKVKILFILNLFFTMAARSAAVVRMYLCIYLSVVTSNCYVADEVVEEDELYKVNMTGATGK